jgi:quinolinate synthase
VGLSRKNVTSRCGAKVLFLPDQHLGRNTAVLKMGLTLDDCVGLGPRTSPTADSPSRSCATRR